MARGPVPLEEAHTTVAEWLSCPNIVMLDTRTKIVHGRDTGEPAITVGVIRKAPPRFPADRDFPVPPTVEVDVTRPDGRVETVDVLTDVVETGRIVPAASLESRQRPCPGGYRIVSQWGWIPLVSALGGTLGVVTTYRNQRCLLTNAHVIARASTPGNPVYQPGWSAWDLQTDWNRIGRCDGTFEIITSDSLQSVPTVRNRYDFAWARVDSRTTSFAVPPIWPHEKALQLNSGTLSDADKAFVSWIGATTGVRQDAMVTSEAAMYRTEPTWGRYAYWRSCLAFTSQDIGGHLELQSGDSGSAVIATLTKRVIGLMTSHSESGSEIHATRIPPEWPAAGDPQGLVPAPGSILPV
ncbi:hypothetical protein [Kitasatospora cineracea]|uniref:Uncharacterized protein n=1 Tax=Kitasatospora cineracea TaxID=88074 RepID=A0A8G1X7X8_9ACTN|nr:hypothetical protein [Kitasatospora cineracea]ROR35864.1 hypothetical protein EDD39_7528 [Kitasatospora cineracea]